MAEVRPSVDGLGSKYILDEGHTVPILYFFFVAVGSGISYEFPEFNFWCSFSLFICQMSWVCHSGLWVGFQVSLISTRNNFTL